MIIKGTQMLSLLHFMVTELRVLWLLWYAFYNTIESIVAKASFIDAVRKNNMAQCLHQNKITIAQLQQCTERNFHKYLARGAPFFDTCSNQCPEYVGVEPSEPRNIFFFISVWLFGFLFVLVLYWFYRRPDYCNGTYIQFTQSLYSSIAYRCAAAITFVVSVAIISVGLRTLMMHDHPWKSYIVSLLLVLLECIKLVELKHDGFNINSKTFCELEISHGGPVVMKIINFVFTSNSKLLDAVEVQFMREVLPAEIAGKEEDSRLARFFALNPLNADGIAALQLKKSNDHEKDQYV